MGNNYIIDKLLADAEPALADKKIKEMLQISEEPRINTETWLGCSKAS